jgi:N-acetylneuraminic acid mutarotase
MNNKDIAQLRDRLAGTRRILVSTFALQSHVQAGFSSPRALLIFGIACCMASGTLVAFFRSDSAKPAQRTLTFAERVAYQRAIEEVYWRHRIWPKDRPDAKPLLDAVMSRAQLEKKVHDYLRKSRAMEVHWQRPITAEQLQAEMDRIAQHTKQPEVLRELFQALGNDPSVVAECLARPVLAERMLRTFAQHNGMLESGIGTAAVRLTNTLPAARTRYTLPTISGAGCVDNWIPTVETLEARDGHTAVWTGTEMIVWGGNRGGAYFNTGGRYNPAIDSWTATSITNAPSTRYAHSAIWTGSEMIVWGGYFYDGSYHWLNTGGRYNPATDTWTVTSTINAPSGRYSHPAVWTGSEMIIWGGWGTNFLELNTGGRYNPNTDSWVYTSMINVPTARILHTAVWTGSEMVIWGGFSATGGYQWFNTGGRYNPNTDTWTPTSTTNVPTGRYTHTAVWTGTEMIIWGGSGSNNLYLNTGGRYNPNTDSWTNTSTTNAPVARESHTAVWTGSKMIVWGGIDQSFTFLNTGGTYDPSTDSWISTSITNAPVARYGHTAIWTGSEMIVCAGSYYDGNNIAHYLNTGGRYNPDTDSWTPTASDNAPDARFLHTAVWTGSEMIVWGGRDQGSYWNTGGRYNPSTDAWAAITASQAPAPRESHTAVWTGNEMVVWGGYFYDGTDHFLNTGGRYNPSTDTWTATSTTNAPSGRKFHTAVWTGNEMTVWGGYYYDAIDHWLNTGGRYNPVTDSWVATSTANAPIGRSGHTAVWTGSEMIVWGGSASGPQLLSPSESSSAQLAPEVTPTPTPTATPTASAIDTGGRYDPGTNSWTATSTTDAPTARLSHTAVWTDSEMIVWGGRDFSNSFNTGGRYSPNTDSWTAISTTNAPAPRFHHTAVWTGNEMIVWGGQVGTYPVQYLDSGGRYNPVVNSWASTSDIGAPTARSLHSTIWSGNEMIVWGGQVAAFDAATSTGARYCGQPAPSPTATATLTPTPTPCTGRCTPTPRSRPSPAPRPTPP